jgi:uncharacterized protein (DUF924 family)
VFFSFMDDEVDNDQASPIWADEHLQFMSDAVDYEPGSPQYLLGYWFGESTLRTAAANETLWDAQSPAVRAEIVDAWTDQFGLAMLETELRDWEDSPQGCLAKLLLLGPLGEVCVAY